MSKDVTVAIVGAGLGGLMAAVALRRRGVHAEVFEQAPELGEIGAGVAIAPNSWRLLQKAGLFDEFAKVASPFTAGYEYLHVDGRRAAEHRPPGFDTYNVVYGIHRADMIDVLRSGVPAETIHTGHRLKSLSQDADGVDLVFENGATFRADAVIGADGIHSVVRPFVTEEHPPVSSNLAVYRAVIPWAPEDDQFAGLSLLWMGTGKHFLIYPVRSGNAMNIVAFVPTRVDAQ